MIANKPNRYFHVTMIDNLDSIKENGIVPSIGYFSKMISESVERIYLFNSFEDMDDALTNWLGEAYESYCVDNGVDSDLLELLICVIDFPDSGYVLDNKDALYESYCYDTIDPKYITFYSESYEIIDN